MRELLWSLKRRLERRKRHDHPTSSPFASGDDFRALSDFLVEDSGTTFLPTEVFPGAIVFLQAYPHLVDWFHRQYAPRIRAPFALITHNQDASMPGDAAALLESPSLVAWFATNTNREHEKLSPIPIGIPNRRHLETGTRWIQELRTDPSAKSPTAYLNFHVGGERERAGYRAKRQQILEALEPHSWTTSRRERIPPREFYAELSACRYVVSPPGHGPDCFRHWEAMLLGCVPVLERGPWSSFMQGLPIIEVDDLTSIEPAQLEAAYTAIAKDSWQDERLEMPYWRERVARSVRPFRSVPFRDEVLPAPPR